MNLLMIIGGIINWGAVLTPRSEFTIPLLIVGTALCTAGAIKQYKKINKE